MKNRKEQFKISAIRKSTGERIEVKTGNEKDARETFMTFVGAPRLTLASISWK